MRPTRKLPQLIRLFVSLSILLLAAVATQAQGPGKAIDFPGTTSFEHINLGDSISATLDTGSFTLEMWINFDLVNNGDPAFIGNKDWNNGANTGFAWVLYNTGALRFNFKPAGGTRRDYNTSIANLQNNWNHIAMVVNRKGSLTAYVNGIQTGTAINIAADSGKTLDGTLPLRLGSDGTGTYNYGGVSRFNGKIDEVRIWKSLRTETEIRTMMCRRLSGNETALHAYYRMDDTAAASLKNFATATTGFFNGTFQNAPLRVISGAPIGDTSVQVYTTNFTGQSLQLGAPGRGTLYADSFSGTGTFLQLYRIDMVPELTGGLTAYNNNNVYYGLFTTNSGLQVYPRYVYNNYDSAVAYRKTIRFFNRKYNSEEPWMLKDVVYNDTANRVLRTDSITGPRQLFLANFVGTCNDPSALGTGLLSYTSAQLTWTSGGSGTWNIRYGAPGFPPTGGTLISNVNTNPYLLGGLQPGTAYEFYVQDTCTGIGASAWTGPYPFSTPALPTYHTIGAGTGIDLNNAGWIDATRNNGQKTTDSALGLPKKKLTLEAWVKIRQFEQWRAIVGFLQDNGSFERGWDLETGDNKKFRFALSTDSNIALNYMESASAFRENEWYHVAGVYDGDSMRLYVNGILEAKAKARGNIAYTSSWLAIGSYKDDNEQFSLRGTIDEVRIWDTVRTQQDLRRTMCQRLSGTEAGLIRYFRLDHYAGDTAAEMVSGLSGKLVGGLVDSNWVISGAAIGDTSIFAYAGDMSAVQLSLNSGNKGQITTDSIDANAKGIHLYRVNNKPQYQQGIADIGTTDKYFGVFPAGDQQSAYRLTYDYSNYPAAVSNNTALHVYNRKNNERQPWFQSAMPNITASNLFRQKGSWGVREYLVADFSTLPCAGPANLGVSNITPTGATVNWTSTASLHSVLYGVAGFQSGNGTTIANIGTNSQVLSSLTIGATYEVYVKDSCSTASSAWTGPVFFQTPNPCVVPVNAFADSIRKTSMVVKWTDPGQAPAFNVSWGPAGFGNPSIGIMQTVSTPRLALNGLQAKTSYDFYLRSDCSSLTSAWAGPFTFTTDSVDQPNAVPVTQGADGLVQVYPNPAHDQVQVALLQRNSAGISRIALYNTLGVCLFRQEPEREEVISINTAHLPAGVYHLELYGREKHLSQKLVIQH